MADSNNGPWGMNPRRPKGGIRARSAGGKFVKNWWAQRWIEAMERLVPPARLARGRHYARLGQVTSLEESKDGVTALVQGSRPKPYKVTIQVTPLTRAQWNKVLDVLAAQALFAARLLAGEMPENIEEAFSAASVSLFPDRASDLITTCTCPDKANPCKHIAAVHYILGDRFDEDPFLLLRLRGQSREQIMDALRRRRGGREAHQPRRNQPNGQAEHVESDRPFTPDEIMRFWEMGAPLEVFPVQIRPPAIPQPLLKRLGEPEVSSQLSLQAQLEDAYEAISQAAMMIAFGDATLEPEPEDEE